MHASQAILPLLTLVSSTLAFPAAGPQQPVAKGPFLLQLNATEADLDVNELGSTSLVSYANLGMKASIWIGGIKSQIYSEPLLLTGNDGLAFTSWHSAPTGFQDVVLYPNETKPVTFTVPHGGAAPPEGAVTSGFQFDGSLILNFKGENKFIGCQDADMEQLQTYQIFYAGTDELPKDMTCTKPLPLKQDAGCSTVG
ncbi:MAG: hypothetical protein M4579_005192 [Chaenotheca gracillima]|nr:MAG: hypothetical protein M4579_005192 [Chaenotheca gracillima]